jgi:ribosome-binding factor A
VADAARARKLAVRIREIAAETLERQVKDPRLGMVTVTDARVTPDLREATIFWTVLGDEADRASSEAALRSATGVVRSAIGRSTGIKFTPTVQFVADHIPDNARLLDDLLVEVHELDAQVAAARVGATYAGEEDPYRKPRVDDDLSDADADDLEGE